MKTELVKFDTCYKPDDIQVYEVPLIKPVAEYFEL